MDGISTITQVKLDSLCDKEEEKHLSADEIFERRMEKISKLYPLAKDQDVSWLVANDECFSRLMITLSQIKESNAFVNLDENMRIKRASVLPVLKGVCMACKAVDSVTSGHSRQAVCMIRAEGAVEKEEEKAGYALLSNAAIATHYARSKEKLRVAIVEFDLGQYRSGSRDMVANHPDILLISVNKAGSAAQETNQESIENHISVTVPQIINNKDLERVVEDKVFAVIDRFAPDLIFMATEPGDCGTGWPDGFKCDYVNKNLMELAGKYAKGRYILILEGSMDEETFSKCRAILTEKKIEITS